MLSATEIKARIRKLQREAEKLERAGSKGIRAVAAYIHKHSLSLDDVKAAFGMSGGRGTRSPLAGTKAKPKFRDDNGNQWSGRGRLPLWLVEAERTGKSRESFLIDKSTKPEPERKPAKPKAKRKSATKKAA